MGTEHNLLGGSWCARYALVFASIVLTFVGTSSAENFPWADPKIPPNVAEALKSRGQFEFVDQTFDRAVYYPWPSFAGENGETLLARWETLASGGRVIYVAVDGRAAEQVAESLVYLAATVPPRRPDRNSWSLPWFIWMPAGPILIFLVLIVVGALSGSSVEAAPTSALKVPKVAPGRVKIEATVAVVPYSAESKSSSRSSEVPAVLGTERVVRDLERVADTGWITRGFVKDGIIRDLHNQADILAAYNKYFSQANDAMKARRDLEQTRRELVEHLEIKALELQIQKASLEAEIRDINTGKRLIGSREDYAL